MLGTFLVFFWRPPNYDVTFTIINRLKVNNDNFKFNNNFKSYIIVKRTTRERKKNTYYFPTYQGYSSQPISLFN